MEGVENQGAGWEGHVFSSVLFLFWVIVFVCLFKMCRMFVHWWEWSNRKGTVVDAGERGADCWCDVLEQGAGWHQGTSDGLASGRCTGSSPE